jgi:hypothetical protein
MIPVSLAVGWLDSIVYVSALSLWALVSGHWAAWQAARVEVAQQREIDEQQPGGGSSTRSLTRPGSSAPSRPTFGAASRARAAPR